VSKDFKQRRGERETVSGVSQQITEDDLFGDGTRRNFPHIALILIACLLRATTRHGITHWYALVEPTLSILFKHLGIKFTPIGPPTHYHGLCVPCVIEVQSLLAESSQFSKLCRKVFVNA
jgi:N-acyl amino acid synthase of PEP-CTERM/exosortase system